MIRSYGVLSTASQNSAQRAFFLLDQQGTVRQRWLPGDRAVLPSEPILQAVREIAGKP